MKVDKQNNDVCYNDEAHKYWNDKGQFISVTTLIGKFGQEFDKEFWSAYKAVEKLLTKEEFNMEKKEMMQTHKVNVSRLSDMYGFTIADFNKAQQDILDEWQKTNADSCERGTHIHSELEHMFTSKKTTDLKKFGIGGKFEINTNETLMNNGKDLLAVEHGVFPEYLIYRVSDDGIFKIAGQIDLLVKDGNDIYIFDYKSNKKIDEKSFFDSKTKRSQMMKYPLSNLMDCNKIHYTLQLSTYAWMIQQLNPQFVIKQLQLIHYDHSNNVTKYNVDYLRDDVVRMCKFYKKQYLLEELKKSREPIQF